MNSLKRLNNRKKRISTNCLEGIQMKNKIFSRRRLHYLKSKAIQQWNQNKVPRKLSKNLFKNNKSKWKKHQLQYLHHQNQLQRKILYLMTTNNRTISPSSQKARQPKNKAKNSHNKRNLYLTMMKIRTIYLSSQRKVLRKKVKNKSR